MHYAIQHALSVLGWLEIPKDDERPPEEIWKDDKEIAAWFAEVKERREREAHKDGDEQEAPLEQNEMTRGLKERLAGK